VVEIDITPGQTTYTLHRGDGLEIVHRGDPIRLRPDEPVVAPA